MTNLNEHNHEQSYADKVTFSLQNHFNSSPIVIKFVLPLRKEDLKNGKLVNQIFLQAASAIMTSISGEEKHNVTIFRSIIERKIKNNLQAVTVILPYSLKTQAWKLLSDGIQIGQKRVPPYSIVEPEGAEYPKRVTISFRNLPNFLPAKEVFECSDLQNFNLMPNIQHQRHVLPNGEGSFFTGMAKAEAIVEDEDTERRLKGWAMESFQLFRNCRNATFQACAFSLLECHLCKSSNLQFQHHPSRCNINFLSTPKNTEDGTNVTENQNAEYVIETSGNEIHGNIESHSKMSPNEKPVPVTITEEMDSSSEEETDAENEQEPPQKLQKPEEKYKDRQTSEDASTVVMNKNTITPHAVVLIYDSKQLRSRIIDTQTAIQENPEIGSKFTEPEPRNFSVGDLTYNVEFVRISKPDLAKHFENYTFKDLFSNEMFNSSEKLLQIIGKFDVFYNRNKARFFCTNLFNGVKLRYQILPPLTHPP